MKITVEPDKCVGGGQCVMAAADLFDQDDDGIVLLLDASPDTSRAADARTAARLCPASAIEITDQADPE